MAKITVSILGCGWLGFPLAKHLISQGYSVKGSTTSKDKLSLLTSAKIKSFHIVADPILKGVDLSSFFSSDVLFLNIPFRRNLSDPNYYKIQIDSVIDQVRKSGIRQVVFASSTSVYPDNLDLAKEHSQFVPDNIRSQVLWTIEQNLLKEEKFIATIVRFAGLYGGERHIGRFLSGKKIEGAEAPVNLIHLEDCIEIVDRIIKLNVGREIVNACSDEHPKRKDLYVTMAKKLGVAPPEFIEGKSATKIVSNTKLKKILGYQFKYPNPLHE